MAIARVLLQDTPVIILDEATANLDTITGKSVMQQLLKLRGKEQAKTLLVITHRLKDMAQFDRILVLDNGEIREQGSHHDLLKNGGLYASMWSLQHRISPPELINNS